jgi:hypothetical protein
VLNYEPDFAEEKMIKIHIARVRCEQRPAVAVLKKRRLSTSSDDGKQNLI